MHRAITRMKRSRRHLPKSAMGRAIDYALTHWPVLTVYLTDGRIEIDNNPVENAIRPTAIGKKNWLFIGEAEAGQRSAVLLTIIEACRSRGIDPQTYLSDVLTRLPTMTNWQIKDVTPAAWAKAQTPVAQRQAAWRSKSKSNLNAEVLGVTLTFHASGWMVGFAGPKSLWWSGSGEFRSRFPRRRTGGRSAAPAGPTALPARIGGLVACLALQLAWGGVAGLLPPFPLFLPCLRFATSPRLSMHARCLVLRR